MTTTLDPDIHSTHTGTKKLRLFQQAVKIRTWTGVLTECCPEKLPNDLWATFTNGTGPCSCVGTVTFKIHGADSDVGWHGATPLTACGGPLEYLGVILTCESQKWTVSPTASTYGIWASGLTAVCCKPFLLVVQGATVDWCNGAEGTVDLVISTVDPDAP